jgi:hypothetical protein
MSVVCEGGGITNTCGQVARGSRRISAGWREQLWAECEIRVRVAMRFCFGLFLGAYVPTALAGLIPDWVHAGIFLMAWLALGYPNELAALGKRREAVMAGPLPRSEAFAVRMRFARARRKGSIRREHRSAWQRATPHRSNAAGMA